MPVSLNEFVPLEGAARWGHLQRTPKIHIATKNGSGQMYVSAEWFVAHDGGIYVPLDAAIADPGNTTTPAKIHIDNLIENSYVAGVIEDGGEITEFRSVHFQGDATEVTDPDTVEVLLNFLAEKYFYPDHPHLEFYFSNGMVANRRWFRIDLDGAEGWDARRLAQPPISERRRLPRQ